REKLCLGKIALRFREAEKRIQVCNLACGRDRCLIVLDHTVRSMLKIIRDETAIHGPVSKQKPRNKMMPHTIRLSIGLPLTAHTQACSAPAARAAPWRGALLTRACAAIALGRPFPCRLASRRPSPFASSVAHRGANATTYKLAGPPRRSARFCFRYRMGARSRPHRRCWPSRSQTRELLLRHAVHWMQDALTALKQSRAARRTRPS